MVVLRLRPHSPGLTRVWFQSCQTLSVTPLAGGLPSIIVDPNLDFGLVMAAVNDFKSLLQEVCQGGFSSIFERGAQITINRQTPSRLDISLFGFPA